MSLVEFRFPKINNDTNEEGGEGFLKGLLFTPKNLAVKTYDIDSKEVYPIKVGLYPGWGVRSKSLVKLAEIIAEETGQNILIMSEDYRPRRPENINDRLEWHANVNKAGLEVLKMSQEKTINLPYSKSCVSVTKAVADDNVEQHIVGYVEGPFFSTPISNTELSRRFVEEGVRDLVWIGNVVGLFNYSIGLVMDVIRDVSTLRNALDDVDIIAQGVDKNLIPHNSLAFQSADDSLFPYHEAVKVWDSIGRAADVVRLSMPNGIRRGHIFPLVEPEYTGRKLIDSINRRFGPNTI